MSAIMSLPWRQRQSNSAAACGSPLPDSSRADDDLCELAKTIEAQTGKSMSAQAVGGAVGHNPISIIIPCHRVLGASGKATGYAGGIDRK